MGWALVVGFFVGAFLMDCAAGTEKRGAAVRVACFMSWIVLVIGLMISGLAGVAWAMSAAQGVLIGGALWFAGNVVAWLWRGGKAAGRGWVKGAAAVGVALVAALVLSKMMERPGGAGPAAAVEAGAEAKQKTELLSEAAQPEDWEGKKRRMQATEENCPCSGEYFCQGPQGGIYCWTVGGRKQYFSRQK